MSTSRRGLMLILSSPSGAGKTTLSRRLLDSDPDIRLSISATTRRPRPGEVDGEDYIFVDRKTFDMMADQNQLLEHASVFEHSYGTPAAPVLAAIEAGKDVLFDIDWQGTQQLAERAPGDVVRVFVLPPSIKELRRRLEARAQDPAEVVTRRMAEAGAEISHWAEYDYVIVNQELDQAMADIQAILKVERMRRTRQTGLADFVKSLNADLPAESA